MENKYIEKLRQLILSVLEGEKVRVILFGSRARRDNRVTSDVDIGLIHDEEVNKKKLVLLKEKVEDLNIPYKVEIVDFAFVSDVFRREAVKGAVIWKD